MSRRRMMYAQSRLPSAYTEVLWIKSDGNQYIRTALYAAANKIVKYTVKHSYDGTQGMVVGQTRTNTSLRSTTLYTESGAERSYYYSGGTKNTGVSNSNLIRETTVETDLKTYCKIWSDGAYNSADGLSIDTPWYDQPFYLFALYNNTSNFKGKIYSFKFYIDDALIGDLVPCVRNSDGIAGMYDTVNKRFYTNSGTGEFTYA